VIESDSLLSVNKITGLTCILNFSLQDVPLANGKFHALHKPCPADWLHSLAGPCRAMEKITAQSLDCAVLQDRPEDYSFGLLRFGLLRR
jgi:hypothetical protein